MSQRERVAASVHANAGRDVGGPLRRHTSEVDRLRADNALLQARVDLLEGLREAFIDAYVARTGRGPIGRVVA